MRRAGAGTGQAEPGRRHGQPLGWGLGGSYAPRSPVRCRSPPRVCSPAPPRPFHSPGSPSTQPPAHATNPLNSDFFKAPLKPRARPEGWGSCTWAKARVEPGGAAFGRRGGPLPGKAPYATPQPSGRALGAGAAQSPIVAWGQPPQSGFCSSTNFGAGTTDCRPRAGGGLRARRVSRPGVSPPTR